MDPVHGPGWSMFCPQPKETGWSMFFPQPKETAS